MRTIALFIFCTRLLLGDSIALNQHALTFWDCTCLDCYCNSSYIETSYAASSTTASIDTPKMITAALSASMPCCTSFYVQSDVPDGSGGITLGLTEISTSTTPVPIVTDITTPFDDSSVLLTYVFAPQVCALNQSFNVSVTLSIVDE